VLIISAVGLLFGGVGAFMLARHTVGPIRLLMSGVQEIGMGNLDQRIEVKTKDEIGELTTAFNDMAKGLREKEFMRDTFERYMSKQLADKLLDDMDTSSISLGGERRYVTVLFTDVRGFTSFSERMDPAEVISLLNEYFTMMVEVVVTNKGWIDKFIGDAMMVTFGVPTKYDDDAVRAVRTGLGMQAAVRELNKKRVARGDDPVHSGIGINTGTVIAGNVGSQERMNYTVIGDAVNLAARLEPLSYEENVLISNETYMLVREHFEILEKGEVMIKGKVDPQKVYEVIREKDA
jgi:class 3 adenylate cyclase